MNKKIQKLQKKNKKRLPRKLKKAVRQCVGYYDGYYLIPPTYPTCHSTKIRYKRRTKWIERACDRYDALQFDWWDGKPPRLQTKRAKIIDEWLSHLYFVLNYKLINKRYAQPRKISAKYHRLVGEIFVRFYKGVSYPNGAWVPKVQPADTYYRACSLKEDIPDSEKWFVEHCVFSYKKLRHECAEKFFITKEEFDSKELSARKLFLKYLEESPEKLIKMKEDETEI